MGVKMLEKIDYNCLNCGAPINRFTMRCEYCDTEYKRGVDDKLVVFDRHIPNTETFHCAMRVDNIVMRDCPEKGMELAKKHIAHSLAKQILKHIDFATRSDPYSFSEILEGRVTVVTSK